MPSLARGIPMLDNVFAQVDPALPVSELPGAGPVRLLPALSCRAPPLSGLIPSGGVIADRMP